MRSTSIECTLHVEFIDEVTALRERLRTIELRIDLFEGRINYRIDRLAADVRSLRDGAIRL